MSRLLTIALVLGVASFAFSAAAPAEKAEAARQKDGDVRQKPDVAPRDKDARQKPEAFRLKTEEAKLSYLIGQSVGESLKEMPFKLDMAGLMAGIRHAAEGTESLLQPEEVMALREALSRKFQEAQAKQEAEAAQAAEKNLAEAKAFLEENKAKEGVQTTESGLQYQVIEPGEGPRPGPRDSVTVHYRGTLLDGEVFDSSYDRGEPITFPLDRVIQGWSEGVQLMRVGAKHRLFIPPDLGYGDRGPSPNALLVFDVELLGIEDAEPPQMQMQPQQELTPEQRRQLERQMEQMRRQQQQQQR